MKPRRSEIASTERVYGVNPVLEVLRREPGSVRRIRVAREARGGAARVVAAAARAEVEVVFDDPRRLHELAGGGVDQGVVAEIAPYRYAELEDLLSRKPGCLLLADQVTDPRNLGALVRSADAAGAGGVVVPRDRAAGVTAVAVKAAAGATATTPIARVTNVARAIDHLKKAGYWIVGLDAAAGESVFRFRFPEHAVIVVGSEGRGLRSLTRAACDHLVSIPMVGKVASLNVGVAGAVALFERLRQRSQRSGDC